MKNLRILIAGCGDVGTALSIQLSDQGHSVYGLRRSIKTLPDSITPIAADLYDTKTLKNLPEIDILVYCAAPSRGVKDAYQRTYIDGFSNLLQALPCAPKHCFFTSSTSVYAQDNHQWIDESSETLPISEKGKLMLCAEQQVQALSLQSTIIRFSGIYGPGREHLINQVKSGKGLKNNKLQYSNRIHRADCASIINHLINLLIKNVKIAPLYLASDNLPTPISEVMSWLAQQTKTTASDFSIERNTPSKRCDNKQLLDTGYSFLYPNYKLGYQEIL